MNSLEEVQQILNDVPAINSGGCGISALTMYKYLKARGENAKFVYLYERRELLEENSVTLNTGNGQYHAPEHVVILHKGKLLDSGGEIEDPEWWGRHEQIIEDEGFVLNTINNADWNWCFNREHVRDIQKKTGIDLSEVQI